MARSKDGYKHYKAGDPIHIVVTQDFVDDANKFFQYCRERGYNPSQIIRQAMSEWMKGQDGQEARTPSRSDTPMDMDDKLMHMVREGGSRKKKMSLRTVKEILEGQ